MKDRKPAVKSAENAFTALEFIVEKTLEKEGATLAEVAEKLGMRKTTARNLLQTMELCGYVTRRGMGFYRLGDQFRRLLMVSESASRLREISGPVLRNFCREFSLPIHLSVFFNGKRHTSLSLNKDGFPEDNSRIADTFENAYRRASTRLLLAFSSPEEQLRFIKEFGPPTRSVWKEGAKNLDSALRKIRENACAVNDDNQVTHVVGMAVGIFDRSGKLCASISTSVGESQMNLKMKKQLLAALREISQQLTDLFTKENIMI